jgi:hypothetical protein
MEAPTTSAQRSAAVCATPSALDEALGTFIYRAADAAISSRGSFALATSGGSFPKSFASALSWAAGAGLPLRTELWQAQERARRLASEVWRMDGERSRVRAVQAQLQAEVAGLLQAVRLHGPLPAALIARQSRLTAQTVSLITQRLLDDGLLLKGEPQRGKVGQPSVPLRLNPEGAYAIGIQVGRRRLDMVLVDDEGTLLGLDDQDRAIDLDLDEG